MPKVTMTFDIPDEQEMFSDAVNGTRSRIIIEEIWDRVFRPNNKHGYSDKLLDADTSYDIINKLSEIYLEVLRENGDDI